MLIFTAHPYRVVYEGGLDLRSGTCHKYRIFRAPWEPVSFWTEPYRGHAS